LDVPGPTPNTPSLAIYVGSSPHDSGSSSNHAIGEIIVYQRALDARERRQLLEYLSAKWGTL